MAKVQGLPTRWSISSWTLAGKAQVGNDGKGENSVKKQVREHDEDTQAAAFKKYILPRTHLDI
jgi:hypothetical protein